VSTEPKRRWRDYRTAAGRRPVKELIDGLSDTDAAAVVAAMRDVRDTGLAAARHLRGDIHEVRADGDRQTYRILFAPEGEAGSCLRSRASRRRHGRRHPRRSGSLRGGLLTGGAEASLNLSDEMPSTL
jgi:hypothetical protein